MEVTASENESGKWIAATCKAYKVINGEVDDSSWDYLGTNKREPRTKRLQIGKYILKCKYNRYKKEVPFEIKAGKTTKVHITFPYFYIESKCAESKDRVVYEIYKSNGALALKRKAPCSKKIKVTLDEGRYTIEGRENNLQTTAKIDVNAKEPAKIVLNFTKVKQKENSKANLAPKEPSNQINIDNQKIEIKGLDKKELKKLKEAGKALEEAGEMAKDISSNTPQQKAKNKKADEEFEKMSKELDMFTK